MFIVSFVYVTQPTYVGVLITEHVLNQKKYCFYQTPNTSVIEQDSFLFITNSNWVQLPEPSLGIHIHSRAIYIYYLTTLCSRGKYECFIWYLRHRVLN